MNELIKSIEQVYSAFADIPKPLQIDACEHCLDRSEIERLLTSPLRELSPDELSSYAASAFLTVGDTADYLYFLPRILEISATDDSWWPDPEVTGRAIHASGLESWPRFRLDALAGFLGQVIADAVESGAYHKIDEWVCAIARMGLDVQPFLTQVATSREAVLAYFEDNVTGLPERRLCNPFWELPSPGHDTIVDWFYSEPIRRIPFDAYGYRLDGTD